MLKLLEELSMLGGVSSTEDEVREFIKKKASKYADEIKTDAMGNLIVFKKGKKHSPKLLICAHMDEVGFIVRKIEDNGYLKVSPVGGIDTRVALGRKVLVGPKKLPGVMGLKAIHLTPLDDRKKIPQMSDLYVDIGAESKEKAEELVSLGDTAVWESDFAYMSETKVKGKALDDRFGCAVMLKLLQTELPIDTTFVFGVQEEVGARGAFGYAFSVKPDIALVLEGTTAADFAGVAGNKKVTRLSEGPVLGFMDAGTVYDRGLFEMMRTIAEEKNVPWQIKGRIAGGTDAQAIQRSREGVRVASISAPLRNIHSPNCVGDVNDMKYAYKLAKEFIKAVADKKY